MKYKILLPLLLISCMVSAQKNKVTAYAITSAQQGQFVWTEVKLIDVRTGDVLQKVYDNSKTDYQVMSAREGKNIQIRNAAGMVTDNAKLPFSTFSAACAYDKKHNRLYYTPMFVNELRYIDLNAAVPKIYYFENEPFSRNALLSDEANHITRMTIGVDGNGYALSNDGNHLVKFTTGRKPVITDLGALRDDPSNGSISVHNRCTSWGGDMIAAADGSLYIVSASHSVFKVDIDNRTAKYIGSIEGLPAGFTSNGAVVADNSHLVVSSANSTDGYYEVDMKNWKASRMEGQGKVFNTSDLANGNIAFRNETRAETLPLVKRVAANTSRISLYPNPVSEGVFRVSFDNDEPGKYTIQLVDLTGRMLLQKIVSVANKGQVAEVELSSQLAKGVYMVKVLSNHKKTVYTDKIIVE